MNTNTNTININEAIAQANRNTRALQIIEEGYTFTQDADTKMVAVCKPGKLAASYFIGEHVDGSNGCDCADKAKTGKPCKHEIAWNILQDEEANEARMWEAQCAQWDAEEGWAYKF